MKRWPGSIGLQTVSGVSSNPCTDRQAQTHTHTHTDKHTDTHKRNVLLLLFYTWEEAVVRTGIVRGGIEMKGAFVFERPPWGTAKSLDRPLSISWSSWSGGMIELSAILIPNGQREGRANKAKRLASRDPQGILGNHIQRL